MSIKQSLLLTKLYINKRFFKLIKQILSKKLKLLTESFKIKCMLKKCIDLIKYFGII